MKCRNVHGTSVGAEVKLGELSAPRCHDLAQFSGMLGWSDAPQRGRGATEEASEARREVTVARESAIERDSREVIAAVNNGIKSVRQTLVQDVVLDRCANHLAEHMA
jgi:hypothetical protein